MLFSQFMHMGKTPKNQSLTKKPLSLLLGLLFIFPFLYYACFSLGISIFVSFPIMILSTCLLLKFTKKKPNTASDEKNPLLSSQRSHIEINEVIEELETHAKQGNKEDQIEPISEESETAQQSGNDIQQEREVLELEDFPSESEVSEQSSDEDNFELKLWNLSSSTDMGKKLPIYGSYFSEDEDDDEDDEDNLIEINLPRSESSSFEEDQKGLMELLADMNNEINEEDNLIEIDISMGSIKCPRFEIKA